MIWPHRLKQTGLHKKRSWLKNFILTMTLCSASTAFAAGTSDKAQQQLDFLAGYFSVRAQTQLESSTTSNFGVYRANYYFPIKNKFKIGIGFTLILAKVYTGDMGYGLDMSLNYFPLTDATPIRSSTDNISLTRNSIWRPYVGGSFNQRTFQIQQTSSYAGFGASLGVERSLTFSTFGKVEFRYQYMAGPSKAVANFIDITAGIGTDF